MTNKTFGSEPREVGFEEYYAAIDADNAWQAALDAAKIDRWSQEASGIEGSELRQLYDKKIAADAACRVHSEQS